jgi:hypothetical protein
MDWTRLLSTGLPVQITVEKLVSFCFTVAKIRKENMIKTAFTATAIHKCACAYYNLSCPIIHYIIQALLQVVMASHIWVVKD